ncbi:hypothetical protein H4J57_15890 [Colwellia sp. BRX8-7]|jgi:chemotaxis response regulator CheB|nr:hypothetical protein [Colwellia sp. BRX8-7]
MVVVQIPANGYICHIRRSAPSMVLDRPLKCYLTLLGKLVGMVIGILLTGMGIDGSQAILRMKGQGNHTICQDRNTSIVWRMAGTAVELGLRIKRDQYTEFLLIL